MRGSERDGGWKRWIRRGTENARESMRESEKYIWTYTECKKRYVTRHGGWQMGTHVIIFY